MPLTGKFARERRTMEAMIAIYCRDHHERRNGLCDGCGAVLAYAEQRLDKCLFPGNKPTCANCPVHCYKPEMRTRVKQIMRYAGPRMIYNHPYLAIRHILDGRNKGPFVRKRVGQQTDESAGAGGAAAGGNPGHGCGVAAGRSVPGDKPAADDGCLVAPKETPPASAGGQQTRGGSQT